MRIHEILRGSLMEGYKEAQTEFGSVIEPTKAAELINQYKVLCQRNQVQGQERNIDYWRKQGVDSFAKFVQQKLLVPSKNEVKRSKIPGKHIDLVDNNEWQIVIPLDKESSCFHGKNTDWCTSKTNASHFENYFYDKSVTLIYLLQKQTGKLWAIACHTDTDRFEMFDQADNSLNATQFQQQTGINPQELRDLALSKIHAEPIQGRRDVYQESCDKVRKLLAELPSSIKPSDKIEKELLFNKNTKLICLYTDKLTNDAVNSLSEDMKMLIVRADGMEIERFVAPSGALKLAAVRQSGYSIKFLDNPSEKLQLAAVSQSGYAIKRIIEKGIIPSESVQLAAVRRAGCAIQYIDNPSEEVQLAAVDQDAEAMYYIKNPADAVKRASEESIRNQIN